MGTLERYAQELRARLDRLNQQVLREREAIAVFHKAAMWDAWCKEAETHGAKLAHLLDDAKHMGAGVLEIHLRDRRESPAEDGE